VQSEAMRQPTGQMGSEGTSRGGNTSRGREVVQLQATQQQAMADKRHWRIKS